MMVNVFVFLRWDCFFNTNQNSVCDVIIQPTIMRALHFKSHKTKGTKNLGTVKLISFNVNDLYFKAI